MSVASSLISAMGPKRMMSDLNSMVTIPSLVEVCLVLDVQVVVCGVEERSHVVLVTVLVLAELPERRIDLRVRAGPFVQDILRQVVWIRFLDVVNQRDEHVVQQVPVLQQPVQLVQVVAVDAEGVVRVVLLERGIVQFEFFVDHMRSPFFVCCLK